MPDDYIGNDLERAAVRGKSAHDLGRWLRSIARIEGPVRGASNWNRDAMLAGALDAVEQFYAGEPDEAIREVVIATSLVLWLDRNVHVVADLLAASIAEQVRARRRTPVENLLAPLLDAGRYVESARATRNGMPNPTATDQERFADAQARLDEGDYPPGEAGRAQEAEDRRFADWYDQAVNGAAQDEFERQCDEAEFRSHYPEPADGTRIEWEGSDGVMRAAARIDYSGEPGNWWVHGQAGGARTWRQLVVEYQIPDGLADVTSLTEVGQPTASAVADERDRSRSLGYVHGLRQAASWLRTMSADPDATGLDLKTMHHLIAGADAMARSASTRLNLDAPESVDASTQSLIVKLGAFVDGEHEYRYSGCHPEPSLDCVGWCEACAALATVPEDLMAQIRALRNP